MLSVVADDADQAELRLDLDVLFGEGARRMLAVALEAEVDAYIAGYANQVDERGHRLVVGNGHAQPARSPPASAGSRWRVLGWTTAGWTRPRPAAPVPQPDPAQVVSALAEGRRGAAAVVPARAVQLRLRPGVD
jgi:hypothetical protein